MSYKKGKYINILSKMKDEDFLCFARKFNCNTIGLKVIRYNTLIWIEEDCGNWEYIFTDFSCEAKRVLPNQNLPTTYTENIWQKHFLITELISKNFLN